MGISSRVVIDHHSVCPLLGMANRSCPSAPGVQGAEIVQQIENSGALQEAMEAGREAVNSAFNEASGLLDKIGH